MAQDFAEQRTDRQMTPETIAELNARLDRIEAELRAIEESRFDQAYPPWHSEREERLRKLKPPVGPKEP